MEDLIEMENIGSREDTKLSQTIKIRRIIAKREIILPIDEIKFQEV